MDLVEIEALKRLKAHYFYFADTQDWDGLRALFTPDCTFAADQGVAKPGREAPPRMELRGAAIVDEIAAMMAGATSVHHGHTPLIDILSDSEAKGVWAMEDIVDLPTISIHGWGHYHETYRKVDGAWKFSSVHLTRLRLTTTAR